MRAQRLFFTPRVPIVPWMRGNGSPERDGKSPWGASDDENPVADSERPAPGESEPRNPWQNQSDGDPGRRAPNLEQIFGPRSQRGGPGGPGLRRFALPLVVALGFGALASSAFHVLAQGEQGLITTFGRYTQTVGPGLSVTLPWPAQQVEVRNTGEIAQMGFPAKGGSAPLLTRDQFVIDLTWQLRWKVRDLKAFAYAVKDPEETLRRLAETQMRAAVAEQPFDAVWDGTGQTALQDRVRQRLQALVDAYRMGVTVEGVEITRADPPARLAESFQKVVEVRDAARKDQDTARKYAEQTLSNAQAEASEFEKAYAEYQQSPEVTRRRIYYETMEKVLGNNRRVVIGGPGVAATVALPPAEPQAAKK